MPWTTLSSILLKTDWQYTEPIEGIYFKLKHSGFPANNSYFVAQAQVNLDGSVELADLQEFIAGNEAKVLYLKAPPVFSNRRLAIKRVGKQASFASELRRVIRNDLLADEDIEFAMRRSTWSVNIEKSDYVEPVSSATTPTPAGSNQYFSNVSLLLHMDGENNAVVFTDVKGKTLTPTGNVKISTTQSKFNGASAFFDGAGDYLSVPVSADLQFGSDNFTWECWCRPAIVTPSSAMAVLGNAQGGATGNSGLFIKVKNGRFTFGHWVNGNEEAISVQTITANTWYHVAATKVGTVLKIFVDGVLGSVSSTTPANTDNPFHIGRVPANAGYATDFSGYIDEVRITKGIARYTENFTPPTSPFPNS